MLPPLMGPSPSSASSSPPDWLFSATSDRDTQILSQAFAHELSTPGASPDAGSDLSGSLYVLRTLQLADHHPQPTAAPVAMTSMCWGSDGWCKQEVFNHVKPLLMGKSQQHQQQSEAALTMPSGVAWRSQDASHHVQHSSLPMGSPSNSHSPMSPSNAGSPYSNVSTMTRTNSSLSMPTDSLLDKINPSHSLHQEAQEVLFASNMGPYNTISTKAEDFNQNSKCYRSSKAARLAVSSRGAGGNKVSKRRSRASNRDQITVISTDVLNFRAVVQQLTGISSTPYMQAYGNSLPVKCQYPTEHPYTDTPNLPTLDTSASFLGPKSLMKEPFEPGFSFAQENHHPFSGCLSGVGKPSLQSWCNVESMLWSSAPNAKESIFGNQTSISPSSSTLSNIWNCISNAKPREDSFPANESQQFLTRQASNALEQHIAVKPQYSAVESWLSYDGVLANHVPAIEVARLAETYM